MKTRLKLKSATAAFLAILTILANPFVPDQLRAYSASTAYYNLAFKGTAYVTSNINVNLIEDNRLFYQNWNSIYGLAATPQQVKLPQAYSTHRGQDWDTLSSKEALYAVHDGTVTWAAYDSTYGNRVEYEFGKWKLSMAHLSQIDVKKGDKVRLGQKLGNVGSTGNVTGEHVHIALYYGGKLVDPHPFITGVWNFDDKALEMEYPYKSGIYTNSYWTSVRVRSGPGTNYAAVGTITPGMTVIITDIVYSNGIVWGKHSLGYSSIREGNTAYMTAKHQAGTHVNVAGLNVMVRSNPTTSAPITGYIAPGKTVQITAFAMVGDQLWGKHAGGWSCLGIGNTVYLRCN